MIKYAGTAITFSEVPDEVTLCINITNCQGKCEQCHSPYLREDMGRNLEDDIAGLLAASPDVTCVCFLGEGNDPDALGRCITLARQAGFKTCLYSGREDVSLAKRYPLNYLKTGPYIPERGGLDSKNTNQRFYAVSCGALQDITFRFWKKEFL